MSPPDSEKPDDHFWQRSYEVTVDHGPRIRLPRPLVKSLQDEGVKEIILFPDPYKERLVLCPDKFCDEYIKMVMEDVCISLKPDKRYRKLICSSEPIIVKELCRIPIRAAINKNFGANEGSIVIIIRVNYWFEIWRKEDLDRET